MREISLYTLNDAREDIDKGISGLDTSIKKWEGIVTGLDTLRTILGSSCGLCLKFSSSWGCRDCPLEQSTEDGCGDKYRGAMDAIDGAVGTAAAMLEQLKEIKKCQQQK